MVKVRPLRSDDNFDGLEDLHNVDYYLHRGIKSSKRLKKKLTRRMEGQSVKHNDFLEVLRNLLLGKRSVFIGVPFFSFGLLLSMLLLLMPKVQRYNTIILPGLAASIEYKQFPIGSVRPQIIITLSVLLSVAVDIFQIINDRTNITSVMVATITLIIICKLALLNAFLRNSQGAMRTRKYLQRRARLFIIPMHEPRRIMRDVRGRLLAIGWLQLVGSLVFFGLFLIQVTYLDYSALYLSPARSDGALPMFLMIKAATLLVVFLGVLYDTDIRLCLWYFGCLGFAVEYVRKYISKKRLQLGGFPLSFAFSKVRFHILCFVKVLDVMWGFYGWVIVSYPLAGKFYSLDTHLQILYGMVAFSLTVFDLWCVTLFLGVRWLVRRRKIVQELGELVDSDDSEIEEFHLRVDLDYARQRQADKAQLSEQRRRLYQLKMKEEQTRFAEGTADERYRGSRAAADWAIQEIVSWVPQGKSRSSIHPSGSGGEDFATVEAAAWEDDGLVRTKQQSNPVLRQLQERAGVSDIEQALTMGSPAGRSKAREEFPVGTKPPALSSGASPKPSAAQPVIHNVRSGSQNASTPAMWTAGRMPHSVAKAAVSRPAVPEAKAKLEAANLFDIDWRVNDEASLGNGDEDDAVLSPLLRSSVSISCSSSEQKLLPWGYSDYQIGYALGSSRPNAKGTYDSAKQKASKVTLKECSVELDPSQPIPAEQFAEIWEILAPSTVSKISTVLVPTQVQSAPERESDEDESSGPKLDPVVEKMLRTEQQHLLTSLITHMRERKFSVAAAGLHHHQHHHHVLKLYCYGTLTPSMVVTTKLDVRSADSSRSVAERMGFVEIKLFPGAVMGGGGTSSGRDSDLQQSYLMECTARSKGSQQAQMFLQLIDFRSILKFID